MYVIRASLPNGAVECIAMPKANTRDEALAQFTNHPKRAKDGATLINIEFWS